MKAKKLKESEQFLRKFMPDQVMSSLLIQETELCGGTDIGNPYFIRKFPGTSEESIEE
ncbi:hypothetical protein PFDG_05076 [Plasmodium falciparum Dd2]|uniref:Uncharacterized protein n=1 Tax=Plasmodium falciparum (isolate Dd2) TaxID=57267 RepID=A0A0L7M9K0_PLAF4|nr:hypothetical protein PFDG_05076 [Plasmodium falciparum Dd2]